MTTHQTAAWWRYVAAAGANASAAVLIATVATPAAAEPAHPGQGDNFKSCFLDAWNKKPTMSYAEKQ